MTTAYDPWSEQDAYNTAIEKGAIYTCPRSGWKFRVRHLTSWSPYPQKAGAIVYARPENAELMKKSANGEKLTKEEEAQDDAIKLEVGLRSVLVGWQGVTDRAGKPIKFELANAMMVMGQLKRLWSDIQNFAANPVSFGIVVPARADRVPDGVDASGNSSDSSDSPSEDSKDS